MAAQDNVSLRLCTKCFSIVPDDKEFCVECGAAYPSTQFSEGSDADVYPELARANLLRMRGDYKQAEDVCLAVLRRYPNNASANTLLGDICAEIGEFDQAISWYELALDLAPNSASDQKKLEYVRQRKAEREAASTAKLLGLPTTRSKGYFVAVMLLLFITAVGIASYYVGRHIVTTRKAPKDSLDISVNVPSTGERPKVNPGAEEKNPATATTTAAIREDASLLARLRTSSKEAHSIIGATYEPRTKHIQLTYLVSVPEESPAIGARLGVLALAENRECPLVTIRAVVDGEIIFVADVTREGLDKTETQEWKDLNGEDATAWTNAIISHEWWNTEKKTEETTSTS